MFAQERRRNHKRRRGSAGETAQTVSPSRNAVAALAPARDDESDDESDDDGSVSSRRQLDDGNVQERRRNHKRRRRSAEEAAQTFSPSCNAVAALVPARDDESGDGSDDDGGARGDGSDDDGGARRLLDDDNEGAEVDGGGVEVDGGDEHKLGDGDNEGGPAATICEGGLELSDGDGEKRGPDARGDGNVDRSSDGDGDAADQDQPRRHTALSSQWSSIFSKGVQSMTEGSVNLDASKKKKATKRGGLTAPEGASFAPAKQNAEPPPQPPPVSTISIFKQGVATTENSTASTDKEGTVADKETVEQLAASGAGSSKTGRRWLFDPEWKRNNGWLKHNDHGMWCADCTSYIDSNPSKRPVNFKWAKKGDDCITTTRKETIKDHAGHDTHKAAVKWVEVRFEKSFIVLRYSWVMFATV